MYLHLLMTCSQVGSVTRPVCHKCTSLLLVASRVDRTTILCVAPSAVDPSRAQLFHQESDMHLANLPDPYGIFLRYVFSSPAASTHHAL